MHGQDVKQTADKSQPLEQILTSAERYFYVLGALFWILMELHRQQQLHYTLLSTHNTHPHPHRI